MPFDVAHANITTVSCRVIGQPCHGCGAPMRYGFPYLLGLPTYTAPSGIRQPLVRLRWMRRGVVMRRPRPGSATRCG